MAILVGVGVILCQFHHFHWCPVAVGVLPDAIGGLDVVGTQLYSYFFKWLGPKQPAQMLRSKKKKRVTDMTALAVR
eukprot:127503-Amphidinium_carterae.1